MSILGAAMIFSFDSNAQTEQGGWLVSGSSNLGFSSAKHKDADDALTSFNINAKVGNFIMENLALGLDLGYVSLKQGDAELSTTEIGGFARYYVGGTFFLGAGYIATSTGDGSDNDNVTGSWINIEGGYPIFLGDNIAIEPALEYNIGGGDANEDVSGFGLNFGFTLYF